MGARIRFFPSPSAFYVCHSGSLQLHGQWPFAMIAVTGGFLLPVKAALDLG